MNTLVRLLRLVQPREAVGGGRAGVADDVGDVGIGAPAER